MKIVLLLAFLLLPIVGNCQKASLFSYDKEKLNAEMGQVGWTQEDFESSRDSLQKSRPIGGFWFGAAIGFVGSAATGCVLGVIPGFLLGTALGSVGALIAYMPNRDSQLTKSTLWGCAVGTGIGTVLIYGITLALILNQ